MSIYTVDQAATDLPVRPDRPLKPVERLEQQCERLEEMAQRVARMAVRLVGDQAVEGIGPQEVPAPTYGGEFGRIIALAERIERAVDTIGECNERIVDALDDEPFNQGAAFPKNA